MSQQDDRPEDAPTEWLSPALYRQLCDAVDAALFAPPDARDGLLAARLGSDQRLLAEARVLLASHESSPRTFITPAPTGVDETFVGRQDSGTMIRRESATVIVAGSGSRPAYRPGSDAGDGTQEIRALREPGDPGDGARANSGTATPWVPPHEPSPTADTAPRVPIAQDAPAFAGARPAWGPPVPINMPPPPMPSAAPPMPPPISKPVQAAPPPMPSPISKPVQAALPPLAPSPAAEPPPPVAPSGPSPEAKATRTSDLGAPIPARRTGSSTGAILGLVVAAVLFLVACGALWMWRQATLAQQEVEARLDKAEKRFVEVRQLGQRLADVDRLLAVTPDTGAQAARAMLLRTWMQYLTDLQRASGSTERELLIDVAKGYRQLAASLGGSSGRTLGDRAGATRTLQIAENLWGYLDRNSPQPDASVRQELIATHVDLGDLYAVAKDAGKASAQYQKALAATGTLSAAGVGTTEVKRITDMVRQRIQSGPPTAAPRVIDGAPITTPEEP